jgi:hypothetical protein
LATTWSLILLYTLSGMIMDGRPYARKDDLVKKQILE